MCWLQVDANPARKLGVVRPGWIQIGWAQTGWIQTRGIKTAGAWSWHTRNYPLHLGVTGSRCQAWIHQSRRPPRRDLQPKLPGSNPKIPKKPSPWDPLRPRDSPMPDGGPVGDPRKGERHVRLSSSSSLPSSSLPSSGPPMLESYIAATGNADPFLVGVAGAALGPWGGKDKAARDPATTSTLTLKSKNGEELGTGVLGEAEDAVGLDGTQSIVGIEGRRRLRLRSTKYENYEDGDVTPDWPLHLSEGVSTVRNIIPTSPVLLIKWRRRCGGQHKSHLTFLMKRPPEAVVQGLIVPCDIVSEYSTYNVVPSLSSSREKAVLYSRNHSAIPSDTVI
ncbi:hypothetical protein BJ875DRAFT_526336 [Amylocarpus encephaloides]|uniref:Uncharacterized protein n=1 Tax=Amylocarpus encephaloides TaxID=45428 RepID=A0A9P7Y8T0_9HELO|nr:hypothetical protein BJ875DRAFT_526336 [Amylocarpus encephaloides]